MNNVVGPIPLEDWKLLSLVRGSLSVYEQRGIQKYRKAYEEETEIYRDTLKPYMKAPTVH